MDEVRVVSIRKMTKEEMKRECWEGFRPGTAIELSDGTVLYPARDEEGNGPGALMGYDKNTGRQFSINV